MFWSGWFVVAALVAHAQYEAAGRGAFGDPVGPPAYAGPGREPVRNPTPAGSGAQADPTPTSVEALLGGQEAAEALLETVLERREEYRPLERALTFRQLITTERLDAEHRTTATATALYSYAPIAGRHLWRLEELDGEAIAGRRLRREASRYRKAVEAAREEREEDLRAREEGDSDYEEKPKNGMDLFYKIVRDAIRLDMFEGEVARGPWFRGRPMVIVRFRPRPGFRGAPDRIMSVVSKCAGELWVDPTHGQVARVRARLVGEENFAAGLFGRLYKGTSADVDSRFDGTIWLPLRVTMTVDARVFFFRRIRRRVHYDFLDFAAADLR